MSKPNITETQAYLLYLENQINLTRVGVDTTWIAICTYLVFLMQGGFVMLESGLSRKKILIYTLFKNLMASVMSTICWWLTGFGIAFGESHSGIIGTTYYGASGLADVSQLNNWVFQWSFVDTTSTIISSILGDRIALWPFCLVSFIMSAWIYPMYVHWAWNSKGWLKVMGYHDFSGSCVVHVVGGVCGFITSIVTGPRKGRFKPGWDINTDRPNNNAIATLGLFMIWYSWFGFNCGSTTVIVGENVTYLVGKVGINTAISASSGSLAIFFIHYFRFRGTNNDYSLGALSNGCLVGLISITASCDNVEPFSAFFIGVIGGCIYVFYTIILNKAIDAIAIHLGTGMWGAIAVGIFDQSSGFLYGKGGKQFGIQILAVVVNILWTGVNSLILALLLRWFKVLKTTDEQQEKGLDLVYFNELNESYDLAAKKYYAQLFFESLCLNTNMEKEMNGVAGGIIFRPQ
jgi:Amt family ammonium transporter